MTLRTFKTAGHAAKWWIDTRAPRTRGGMLSGALPGRSTSLLDIDATIRAIERAICVLPAEWRGVVVVNVGWRKGPKQLQDPAPDDGGLPYLDRADLPWTWRGYPAGLTVASLRLRREKFADALVTEKVLTRRVAAAVKAQDAEPVTVFQRSEEERMEKALNGWKEIASAVGVSERTAQTWAEEEGLPVIRGTGKRRQVMALPSQLQAWMEARVVASLAAVRP